MGFNPNATGLNDRLLSGADKLHGGDQQQQQLLSVNGGGHPPPFPTMPFFLPSMNGNALQNMAAAAAVANSERGAQTETSTPAGKQPREGSNSAHRNGIHHCCTPLLSPY